MFNHDFHQQALVQSKLVIVVKLSESGIITTHNFGEFPTMSLYIAILVCYYSEILLVISPKSLVM